MHRRIFEPCELSYPLNLKEWSYFLMRHRKKTRVAFFSLSHDDLLRIGSFEITFGKIEISRHRIKINNRHLSKHALLIKLNRFFR